MAHYAHGSVVVNDSSIGSGWNRDSSSGNGWSKPAEKVITKVVGGPWNDGSYDLEGMKRVPARNISRLSSGESVEYYSASMNAWIPARVVREGKLPGTVDLDCKESVDAGRMRWPQSVCPPDVRGMPAPVTADSMQVPSLPCAASGSRSGSGSGREGPYGLRAGDLCFYKSAAHGWISAKVLQFNTEDGTYSLDVKPRVRPENMACIQEGLSVEYHSTSTDNWIPARILRAGHEPGTFDLDCKIGVSISRIRPAPDINAGGGRQTYDAARSSTSPPYQEQGGYGVAGGRPTYDGAYRMTPPLSPQGPGGYSNHTSPDRYGNPMSTSAKMDQLRQAVNAEDVVQVRQRLESQSVLKLQGPELDRAAHALWQMEAKPAALAELRQAAAGCDARALEAAIEAAEVVGVPDLELEAASLALRAMERTYWCFDPRDGKHMDIRSEPQVDAKRVQHRLTPREIICVSEERKGQDGILYLKLADGRGWVFEAKPGVGALCVRHLEETPGVYLISHDKAAVTPGSHIGSDDEVLAKLDFGTAVNVVEVRRTAENRVRARIEYPPGWISLVNTENGKRWAQRKQQ